MLENIRGNKTGHIITTLTVDTEIIIKGALLEKNFMGLSDLFMRNSPKAQKQLTGLSHIHYTYDKRAAKKCLKISF